MGRQQPDVPASDPGILRVETPGRHLRGTIVAASLGMAAGGYMGGLLFDISGSYQASLWFSLTAGVISIALIPFLKPLKRRKRKDPVLAPVSAPAVLKV